MLVKDGGMLVNDGEILVNDGERSIWSHSHLTIINEHFSSISLKYTINRLSDHHWDAAPTARLNTSFPGNMRIQPSSGRPSKKVRISWLWHYKNDISISLYIISWFECFSRDGRKKVGSLCYQKKKCFI